MRYVGASTILESVSQGSPRSSKEYGILVHVKEPLFLGIPNPELSKTAKRKA